MPCHSIAKHYWFLGGVGGVSTKSDGFLTEMIGDGLTEMVGELTADKSLLLQQ